MTYNKDSLNLLTRANIDKILKEEFGLEPSDYKNRNDSIAAILDKQDQNIQAKGHALAKDMVSKEPDPMAAEAQKVKDRLKKAELEQAEQARLKAMEQAKAAASNKPGSKAEAQPDKPKAKPRIEVVERNLKGYINSGPRYWPLAEKMISKMGDLKVIDRAKWNKILVDAKAEYANAHRKHKKTFIIGKAGGKIKHIGKPVSPLGRNSKTKRVVNRPGPRTK
jgi:hypothetical protein